MELQSCVGFADRGVWPVTDVHRLLHGPLGSTVSITLVRAGSAKHVVKLTRASLLSQSTLSPRHTDDTGDNEEDGYRKICPRASSPTTTPRFVATKPWAGASDSQPYAPIPSLSPPGAFSSQTDDEADDGRAYQAWKAGALRAQAAQARLLKRQSTSSCVHSEARPPLPAFAGNTNVDGAADKRKDKMANSDAADSIAAMVGWSAHTYSQTPARVQYGRQPVVPPLMLDQLPEPQAAHDAAGRGGKVRSSTHGPVCTAREPLAPPAPPARDALTRLAALKALNTEVGAAADTGPSRGVPLDERSEGLWLSEVPGHVSPEEVEVCADTSEQQVAAAVVEQVQRQWAGGILVLVCDCRSLCLQPCLLKCRGCRGAGKRCCLHARHVFWQQPLGHLLRSDPHPATAQNSREGMTQRRRREGGRRRKQRGSSQRQTLGT